MNPFLRGSSVKHLPGLAMALAVSVAPVALLQGAVVAMAATGAAADAADKTIDARFSAFLDQAEDAELALSPEALTGRGSRISYDRLDDYTEAGEDKVVALLEAQLATMKREFPAARLNRASQLSFRLFEFRVAEKRERKRWWLHEFAVTNSVSPTGEIPVLLMNRHKIASDSDAVAYVARLGESERVMREISANLRRAAAAGIVPPDFTFAPVLADTRKLLQGAPFDSGADNPLFADFKNKLEAVDLPATRKAALTEAARAALTGPFKAGYEAISVALEELAAKATTHDGAWSLPDGAAYYNARLRYHTTTGITAEQVHQTGLAEVARIRLEMEAIKARVGFTGTLQAFFEKIKADPASHYANDDAGRAAYLADARGYIAQAMQAAPRFFKRLPKAALEVRAVETWRQDTAPVAFYNGPAPDGSRPGIYYVNLADMNQVLKPQIEGITYHEAAPGHHFQIAFAQELPDVPKFRRFGFYGAYVEGWGLYAEKLGKEMGFYRDPMSEFGRLSTEMWRAVRLVTDSGMHARRWTREQAIKYFQDNTLLSERDIVKEVERYLNWPGQATSYKVGEQRILQLRTKAEKELGSRFKLADFHDVVLRDGALPLDVLSEQVDAYIAAKKGK
jgi:uncharacterized protein (DUF885 family)